MDKRLISICLSFIFLFQFIIVSFLDFKCIMYLSLFNAFFLLVLSIYLLLSDFSGFAFVLLGFAVFTFMDMFKSSIIFGLDYPLDFAYVTTAWYAYFSFFIVLFSYTLITVNPRKKVLYVICEKKILIKILPLAVFITVLITFTSTKNPIFLLVSFLPKGLTVCFFYLYLTTNKKRYCWLAIFLSIFAFLEISRRVYITLFLIVFALYLAHKYNLVGRISKKVKFISILLFGLVVFFMGLLRSNNVEESYYVEDSKVQTTINNLAEMRAIDTFDNTAFIIREFPRNYDYYYGETYFAILVQFLPRSFWEEKPVSLGAPLGLLRKAGIYEFTVDAWHNYVNNHSYSPGFQGEAYANFGPVGVFLLSLLLGIITKIFDCKIRVKEIMNDITIIPYLSFYSFFFLVSRGDLLMASYYSILFYISIKLIFYFTLIKQEG